MTCMFIATSCEKAEIQKTGTLKHIEGRSCPITNCDECPDDDCCCAIELVNGSDVTLELCGTSSPNCLTTQTCYVDGLDPNCPDISGFLEYITLTAGSPRDCWVSKSQILCTTKLTFWYCWTFYQHFYNKGALSGCTS